MKRALTDAPDGEVIMNSKSFKENCFKFLLKIDYLVFLLRRTEIHLQKSLLFQVKLNLMQDYLS